MSELCAVRVLHVTQSTGGGVRRYLLDACADQLGRGWCVAVACPDDGPLAAELHELGVPRLGWRARRAPGPSTLREVVELRGIVERVGPDVVHLHSSKAGLAGRLAVRGRLPTIFQPHGWSWLAVTGATRWLSLRWERLAVRWASVLVCVGDDEAGLGRELGVVGWSRVVRNGIDLTRYRPASQAARRAARRWLGVPEDVGLVVCAGRLTRQKGQDLLVEGWPGVLARCPDALLACVGGGELLHELRAGAPDRVRFVPAVADLRPWFAAADLVAVPSRWEGLPLTALEAAAMGRPVVGFAVPGLIEVVTPAVGALVPPGDLGALAEAIARRLLDPELARGEGAAAGEWATGFDQRVTLDRLASVTLAVASEHRRLPVRQS
ncbi:glycosyltransferase [Pseudonocardia acaciae]|uniref:glycosyltransferase n=1 Tax=Pseudonocardia acaciae TaxID=551276 RepID=UPI000684E788|nr:glycosyltransferase [Pseudonocardia acaciae]